MMTEGSLASGSNRIPYYVTIPSNILPTTNTIGMGSLHFSSQKHTLVTTTAKTREN